MAGNFRRREISLQAVPAGKAELASHAATRLGGDANGPVTFAGNQDAFDEEAILQPEENLFGCIPGGLNGLNLRLTDPGQAGQLHSEILCQVGHLLERNGPALIKPFHDLPGPILFFAVAGNKIFDFLQGQVSQIGQLLLRHTASSAVFPRWRPASMSDQSGCRSQHRVRTGR